MVNKDLILMEIIPAIDLLGGECVRLNQGDYNKVTQFNSNPIDQAIKWESSGAERLHLVDLDGAKTGNPVNDDQIKKIKAAINIPIQVGGGIRTFKRAEELLEDYGINRIILGTVAIEDFSMATDLANKFPGRIAIGIDSKNGKVATRGWIKESEINATDLTLRLNDLDLAAIISTDITTDGTLKGPNLEDLSRLAQISKNPVIASGGVGSISDLISLIPLETEGISGVIVGRALYDGSVNLKEAIKVIDNRSIQDAISSKDEFLT